MESNTADCAPAARRPRWIAAAILTAIVAGSHSAHAVESVSIREISREQATQILQKRYGNQARVVRTDVVEQGGHHIYVFRLLSVNGRVWIVRIDAQSGAEVP